ncbi:hypothetical protein IWQ62_005712 [Dispira parvispora]|uniref:DUF4097 domain-containing protein n=1 Tax=Dispira parvispora TaxID=1520584 RepID=A0A9W8ALQ5_9FUNG|nr:hypothetical protein IWQ62_005712 [Dispira parvispora]
MVFPNESNDQGSFAGYQYKPLASEEATSVKVEYSPTDAKSVSPPDYETIQDEQRHTRRVRRLRRFRKCLALSLASLLLLGMFAFYGRPMCRRWKHHLKHKFLGHPPHHHLGSYPDNLPGGQQLASLENCPAELPYTSTVAYEFDPSEYDHFASRVQGVVLTDVDLTVSESDGLEGEAPRVKVTATVEASTSKLLEHTKVGTETHKTNDGKKGGHHRHHPIDSFALVVKGPHYIKGKDQCIRAKVQVTVPKGLKTRLGVLLSYLKGQVKVQPAFGKLNLHAFHVATVDGDLIFDQLRAQAVVLNTVRGHVEGSFDVEDVFVVRTVSGNVDAAVHPKDPKRLHAKVQSVSGNVKLEVDESYNGAFEVASVSGHTEVKGSGVSLRTDLPQKKMGVHQSTSDSETLYFIQPVSDDQAKEASGFHPKALQALDLVNSWLDYKFNRPDVHNVLANLPIINTHTRPYEHPKGEKKTRTLERRGLHHGHGPKHPHDGHFISVGSLSGNLLLVFV